MNYRPDIDSLRALAVIPVVFYHAGFSLFAGGYIGVDVFFVISGFLITELLLKSSEENSFSYVSFLSRRLKRILPAFLFVSFLCLPVGWLILLPQQKISLGDDLISVGLLISNLYFWLTTNYFSSASQLNPLIHTWSLCLELQFYFFFPLIFIFAVKKKVKFYIPLIALMIISLCFYYISLSEFPLFSFYVPSSRFWEFCVGSLIAIIARNPTITISSTLQAISSTVALIVLSLCIFLFDSTNPIFNFFIPIPAISAGIIILCRTRVQPISQMLESRYLVQIGLMSYGLYLVHQPALAFTRHFFLLDPPESILFFICLASFPAAYLLKILIEDPVRKMHVISHRYSLLIFLGLSISLSVMGYFFSQLSLHFDKHTFQREIVLPNSKDCLIENRKGSRCYIIGDPSVTPSYMLWGDSHAEAISFALHQKLKEAGQSAYAFTLGGCLPVPRVSKGYSNRKTCINLSDDAMEFATSKNKDLKAIFIVARWSSHILGTPFDNGEGGREPMAEQPPLFFDINTNKSGFDKDIELQTRIRLMINQLPASVNINFIKPIPAVGWNVPDYLEKYILKNIHYNRSDLTALPPLLGSTSASIYQDRHKTFSAMTAIQRKNLHFIDTFSLFCPERTDGERRCLVHQNGNPFYFDDNHLSNFGANLLIEFMQKSQPQLF